jgi:hypothetical protein
MWSLLLAGALVSAAPTIREIPAAGLEAQYQVDGLADFAFRIESGRQRFTLLLSRTGSFPEPLNRNNPDIENRAALLYATLFSEDSDGFQRRWQVNDRVDDCPLDLTLRFTEPQVAATDLDNDGEPEIWVSYFLACRGDVSPATLKLIGYEGTTKYALRGTARLTMGEHSEGGDYSVDASFSKAPPAFLPFAKKRWAEVREEYR